MQAGLLTWRAENGWQTKSRRPDEGQLVFYFGSRAALESGERFAEIRAMFPTAHLVGCSTGGQILGDEVSDDDIAAVVLSFERTRLKVAWREITGPDQSRDCGVALGNDLRGDDLAAIFILSDGLNVNGSALVCGLASAVGPYVPLTGGLAGDGADFSATLVGVDEPPRSHSVGAVGFYGDAIRIGHGSGGGWDVFGPRRRITCSAGNVLYELDGKPALDLYERYLGADDAAGLPSTGLLFPLRIYDADAPDMATVRTILAVDRDERSMTFAGDMPKGWVAQLMRGTLHRLAAGAATAARKAHPPVPELASGDELALLVSCIGRRLLLGQQTLDEVEAVGAELGRRRATYRLLFLRRDLAAPRLRRLPAAQPDHDHHDHPRGHGVGTCTGSSPDNSPRHALNWAISISSACKISSAPRTRSSSAISCAPIVRSR